MNAVSKIDCLKGWQTFFAVRRRYYRRRWQTQMESLVAFHEAKMLRFWTQVFQQHKKAIIPLVGQLDLHSMSVNQLERSSKVVDVYDSPKVIKTFRRIAEDAATSSSRRVAASLGLKFKGLPETTSAWLKQYVPKIVDEISTTTKKGIMKDVYESVKLGESVTQAEDRIRETYDNWIDSRPATIARTEIGAITQQAGFDTVEELAQTSVAEADELIAIWLTAQDDRVRPSHQELDGEEVVFGESFLQNDTLRFPSDPEGPPEETINCRCVLLYEIRPREK